MSKEGLEMRKTIEDMERAARCEYSPNGVKQLAIEILVELRAGYSFNDPYVEALYDKLVNKIGCHIPEKEDE